MGNIPEGDTDTNNFLTLLQTAATDYQIIKDENGKIKLIPKINTKKLDYKTQMVDYIGFGNFVFEKEELENLAKKAYNYMSKERAKMWEEAILALVRSYGYVVDSESSKTMRDNHNPISSLTHILLDKKIEKHIRITDEAGRSFVDMIKGKQKNEAVNS